MSRARECRPGLCVVVISGRMSPASRRTAAQALENRGFEVFGDRALPDATVTGWPAEPDATGARILIAFNPLISDPSPGIGARYGHGATDSAVYHLGAVLGAGAADLRVAQTARQADAICRRALNPAEIDDLNGQIALRRAEMQTRETILADLSRHKHRAKVELVRWNGGQAVKKTFRATAQAAMRREIAFHDDIAPLSRVPARILARSDNALYYEYIESRASRRPLPSLLSLENVRRLADFARLVTARGWDPVDLTPRDNILIERTSGAVRAIDFEFAFRRAAPVAVERACFLAGIGDAAFDGLPLDPAMRRDPYPGKWRPFTGLSRHSLLNDPIAVQRFKRAVVHPLWLMARAGGSVQRRRAHLAERAAILSALALPAAPGD
ncbi:hypothetical protein [Oceaniglobus indicus]|uniref:hypothetical protein n=1 Tax=Oceaniglobus indicus TaxID=2047749 RepID=UPI000C17FCC3|nr:hypothetical protein [Oceaniglobus indicus]